MTSIRGASLYPLLSYIQRRSEKLQVNVNLIGNNGRNLSFDKTNYSLRLYMQ